MHGNLSGTIMGIFFLEREIHQKISQTLQMISQWLQLDSAILLYWHQNQDEILQAEVLAQSPETNPETLKQSLHFFEIFHPDNDTTEYIINVKQWFNQNNFPQNFKYFNTLQSLIIHPITLGSHSFHVCLSRSTYDINYKIDTKLLEVFLENLSSFLNKSLPSNSPQPVQLASNELFHMIFNAVPEAISFHELPSHRTIAVNNAFLNYTGYQEDEVLNKTGRNLNLWFYESEREKYRELMEKDGFVQNFSAAFKFKNGEKRIGLISSKIVLFGGSLYLLVIIRDIQELITAQKALQSNEIKFKSIFNLLPDAICINNFDQKMTLTDVNQAFLQNFNDGKAIETSQKNILNEIWDMEGQKTKFLEYTANWQNIDNMQARLRFATGQSIEYLVSSKIIPIDGELNQLVLFKNIDDIIRMKKAIKMSEEKFRSIFNASPDAINITLLSSSQLVDVNDSFLELTKYTKAELIGHNILDFGFWHKPEQLQEYISRLESGQNVENLETVVKINGGVLVNVLISASLVELNGEIHILNITRNINELKMIQLGLRQSENRFRTIVEKSHASICIIDDNGCFSYTNPRSQFLFGYPSKEIIGKKFDLFIHPDDLDLVKTRFLARQAGEDVPEEYEFKIVIKGGDIREVEIRSSAYTDINGKTKTIAQLLDITDRNMVMKEKFLIQQRNNQYIKIAAFMLIAIDVDGKIELVNNKACEILGYSEKELLGENWIKKCVPKSHQTSAIRRFIEVSETKTGIFKRESMVLTSNGKERLISWQTTPLFNENNEFTGTLSSGEDITDKVNSMKILEQSRVIAIVWEYSESTNIHRVVYISNNVENILGYTAEELLANNPRYIDMIHPADMNHVVEEVNSFTRHTQQPNYSHEYYRLRCKNGDYIWVEDKTELVKDEKGKITHLNGLLIDVTEKKKSLEMIRESEERYRTIFNSNLDGIAIFNSDGKIVEVNEVLCQMYGYTRDEILNRKDHNELNIGSNLHIEQVKATLKLEQSVVSESVDTRKDGSTFHVNLKLHWIHYNYESHLLANIRDITDKKMDELTLLDAKNKAEESDQLKSSFLANMSHEIRTPMNSILGFASLLEEEDLDEDEKGVFVSRIKSNGQLLLNLLNDIVDISKIEANQIAFYPTDIHIIRFLNTVKDRFDLLAQTKKVNLNYTIPDEYNSLIFIADSNRLMQVITNLISNSLKFTAENGNVQFGLLPKTDQDYLVFFVKDNGIGIPQSEFDHIFTRFRQAHKMTHTDYGGTGLGLSISQGLIHNMGGHIWFESEEHVGTRFFFSLPLQKD